MAIARVDEFISALKMAEKSGEDAIKKACESELEYLRTSLGIERVFNEETQQFDLVGSASTLHSILTDYRNAVRALELTPSITWEHERGRSLIREHIALKYLVKNSTERSVRGEKETKQKYKKHTNIHKVDADSIILVAEGLLDQSKASRPSYQKIALGLMLLTGRRPIEILKTASFVEVDDYFVEFSGQAKTKGSENAQTNPYIIPTLASAEKCIEALEQLRQMKDFSEEANEKVHSKTNTDMNKTCKKVFGELIPNTSLKALRAVYAAICENAYRHETTLSREAYVASILGHSEEDVGTAQSYVGYEVL